jgi:hypothetical protein
MKRLYSDSGFKAHFKCFQQYGILERVITTHIEDYQSEVQQNLKIIS